MCFFNMLQFRCFSQNFFKDHTLTFFTYAPLFFYSVFVKLIHYTPLLRNFNTLTLVCKHADMLLLSALNFYISTKTLIRPSCTALSAGSAFNNFKTVPPTRVFVIKNKYHILLRFISFILVNRPALNNLSFVIASVNTSR